MLVLAMPCSVLVSVALISQVDMWITRMVPTWRVEMTSEIWQTEKALGKKTNEFDKQRQRKQKDEEIAWCFTWKL